MTPTTRTDAYRFTVQSLDDPRLADLRKEVALRNKDVAWSEPQEVSWRDRPVLTRMVEEVKVRARLGKESPKRERYRTPSGRLDTQCVRLEDGSHFDVYVHLRYREKEVGGSPVVQPPEPKRRYVDIAKSIVLSRLNDFRVEFDAIISGMPEEDRDEFRRFTVRRLAESINHAVG